MEFFFCTYGFLIFLINEIGITVIVYVVYGLSFLIIIKTKV